MSSPLPNETLGNIQQLISLGQRFLAAVGYDALFFRRKIFAAAAFININKSNMGINKACAMLPSSSHNY